MHTLTDTRIRSLAGSGKTQRHWDGGGLYLEISPAGSRWWRFKCRQMAKKKRLSLGTYPNTSLKEAREKAAGARKLLESGVDPSAERQAVKFSCGGSGVSSFEAVAREWFATIHKPKVSEGQPERTIGQLERDVFP